MPSLSWNTLLCPGSYILKQLCRVTRVSRILIYACCSYFCRTLGVYVKVITGIAMKDILKFSVIFMVSLYVFVGSFYLALKFGWTVDMSSGAITTDLQPL